MLVHLRRSLTISFIFFVLLGLVYPLLETGIGQTLFPSQANGSLTKYGSVLVGQKWTSPIWFHGRADQENPMATGGTNLGPRSNLLLKDVSMKIAQLKKEGITPTPDLVTSSGSGIDPDISPLDAYSQAKSIAKARRIPLASVDKLIAYETVSRQFGFLGSPYLDVLSLNRKLSQLK